MSLTKLDLNLLTVFDTIYREGSLTRASRALYLTQPAVSHSLGRLRDYFDDPLFVRQGNRMVPTPMARRLAEDIRPGLAQLQSAINPLHHFQPEKQGKRFTLALRDVLESTFLPALLEELAPWPHIEIVSQRVPRRDMEGQLASGNLDFALDVLLPVSDRTAHEPLREDRLVVVAREGHPLEGRLDLAGYLEAGHVLVSSRAEGPGIEDFELSRQGHRRRIALRCQHYFAACRVAEQTDLLVTMPALYANILSRHLAVALMPVPVAMAPIDVHLYWHRNYGQEPALVWLRDRLRRVASLEGNGDSQ